MTQTRPEGETLVDRATEAFGRYQAGERAAFDTLVEVVSPVMWRVARGAGLDQVTGEDVLQTVWMSALRSAGDIRDTRTIVKWLLTSTRREAWRVSKRTRAELHRAGAVFGVDSEEVMAIPDSGEAAPDEVVFRDDRQRRLWEHVKELPERCRQLLSVIAFADRPDYAHLADALGMPVGSIGPTRGRCLAKLRDVLTGDPRWGEGLAT
ncbi:MAG TPA: sigma-70 family RNA polymerase sigma factor [Marmoricola sp.]|nr:sigma-70 family RNA polymerase sigma factor [Marmoricola sp.]